MMEQKERWERVNKGQVQRVLLDLAKLSTFEELE